MSSLNGKVHSEMPLFEFRQIDTGDVDRHWFSRVHSEVMDIIAKEHCEFLPEEVYVTLRRKRAHLCLLVVRGEIKGWVILQAQREEWSGKGFLLIWLGHADTTEAKDLFFNHVETFARERKFQAVRLNGRAGWMRKPPNPKWRIAEVICELRIEELN